MDYALFGDDSYGEMRCALPSFLLGLPALHVSSPAWLARLLFLSLLAALSRHECARPWPAQHAAAAAACPFLPSPAPPLPCPALWKLAALQLLEVQCAGCCDLLAGRLCTTICSEAKPVCCRLLRLSRLASEVLAMALPARPPARAPTRPAVPGALRLAHPQRRDRDPAPGAQAAGPLPLPLHCRPELRRHCWAHLAHPAPPHRPHRGRQVGPCAPSKDLAFPCEPSRQAVFMPPRELRNCNCNCIPLCHRQSRGWAVR